MATFNTAQAAMHLSFDGRGQILYFPIYSVQGWIDTLLSLTNAGPQGKLVAARFFDAKNSRLVFGMHLFLSPYDVWTAALSKSAGGGATLKSSDTSCTQPQIPSSGVRLSTSNFTEGLDNSLARTEIGFIEVIEAADAREGSPTLRLMSHVSGVPLNCASLPGAGQSASSGELVSSDFLTPTGTLSEVASLISVGSGIEYSFDAVAKSGAFDTPQLHVQAQSGTTIENVDRTITFKLQGKTNAAQFADGVDAISALFLRSAVAYDWSVDPAINAATDTVTTFPTRRFFTAVQGSGFVTRTPFTEMRTANGAFEQIEFFSYDREERASTINCDPCPYFNPHGVSDSTVVTTIKNSRLLSSGTNNYNPPVGSEGFLL